MKSNTVFSCALSLLFALVLVGCSIDEPIVVTPTVSVIGKTPKPSLTPTDIFYTPTVSLTLTPTPSPKEIRQVFLDVLNDNGGCRLPCVWGLTPGETTLDKRQTILAKIGKVSIPGFRTGVVDYDDEQHWGDWGIRNFFINGQNNTDITVSLLYFDDANVVEQIQLNAATSSNFEVVFGDSYYQYLLKYYSLSQILSNYGHPSSVLLAAWHYDPFLKADYEVFSLVVVYSDLGFLIEYISPSELIGDYIRGCPMEAKLNLWSWDPNNNLSLAEIVTRKRVDEGFTSRSMGYFKPVEEATSMTLDEFYQVFKDPNNVQCLETPGDLWPKP